MRLVLDAKDREMAASHGSVEIEVRAYWEGPGGELLMLASGKVTLDCVAGVSEEVLKCLKNREL